MRPEFSRLIDLRQLGEAPQRIGATREECAALAARFELISVVRLDASVTIVQEDAAILVTGRLRAEVVQSCAISGELLAVQIDEPLALRFVPARPAPAVEEIELAGEELDEIEFQGSAFDLGEAVAQSLALAIDPYATGPQAEKVRAAGLFGDEVAGPFAALAGLKTVPSPQT